MSQADLISLGFILTLLPFELLAVFAWQEWFKPVVKKALKLFALFLVLSFLGAYSLYLYYLLSGTL